MQQEMMLISSAMISSIWEANKKDTIDLIIPFVKYVIFENYDYNIPLDNSFILLQLRTRFCFDTFPNIILEKVLNRLSKSNGILLKENGNYYIKNKEDNYTNNFVSKENKYKNITNDIIDSFKIFLKNNCTNLDITTDNIEEYLYNYLSKYINKTLLNEEYNINPKFERQNFWISKYLYYLKDTNDKLFDSFNDLAVGFMLSKALYFDNSQSSRRSSFKVYFDAPLMLSILGLKSIEENDSADQLIKLLKENNIEMLFFSHSVEELKSIITDYLSNRSNPFHKRIEYFDENKVSDVNIESYRDNIEDKIANKGILITDINIIQNITNVSDIDLFNVLKNTYSIYAKDKAIKNDTVSLKCIINLRNSYAPSQSFDRCKYIFISKNNDLVRAGKFFIKCKETEYGLAITENDLITMLWIRSKKSIRNISKLKLINYARLSLEPSPLLINTYINTIDQLKKDKNSVPTDFLVLLEKINNKRELMEISQGQATNITKEAIINKLNVLNSNSFKLPVVSGTEKLISKLTNICRILLIVIISILILVPNIRLACNLTFYILGKAECNIKDIFIAIFDAIGVICTIFNFSKKTDWFAIKIINYLCNKFRNLLYIWCIK